MILTRLAMGLPADPWAHTLHRTADAARVRHLVGAAAESRALVAIAGRRGTGKTLAVRAALDRIDALVVEPCRLDRDRLHIGDIVTALVTALSDERPRHGGEARAAQARRLLGLRGGRVVLFVDDAHVLAPPTLRALKRLREWSFRGRSPLLAVVLAGQAFRSLVAVPEVDRRTSSMEMAGLTEAEARAAVSSALGRVCPPAAAARLAASPAARNWLDLQRLADRALAEAHAAGAAELTPRHRRRGDGRRPRGGSPGVDGAGGTGSGGGAGPRRAEDRMSAAVTAAQLRAIHAAANAAGLDDDAYRDRLRALAGVSSARDLSRSEASTFLADLGLPAPRAPKRRSPPGRPRPRKLPAGVVRLATPAQDRLIRELIAEVRWDGPDAHEHFQRWMSRSLRMRVVRTSADARRRDRGPEGAQEDPGAMRPDVLIRAVADALLLHGRAGPFNDEELCRAITRSVVEAAEAHGAVPTRAAVEEFLARADRNRRIRRLRGEGVDVATLGRRFGLSTKQVSRILDATR